jgi:hypothetical protein
MNKIRPGYEGLSKDDLGMSRNFLQTYMLSCRRKVVVQKSPRTGQMVQKSPRTGEMVQKSPRTGGIA